MNVNQLKLLMEINTLQKMNPFQSSNGNNNGTSFATMLESFLLLQSLNNDNALPSQLSYNGMAGMNIAKNNTALQIQSLNNIPVKIANEQLEPIIEEASQTYNIPKALIAAVIKHESNFNINAVSSAGARGLMQLMPNTAKGLGVKDIHDPRDNIMGGTKYLRQMLDKFGTIELALAAYNAGPGNVNKYGGIPPFEETQNYVKKVTNELRKFNI